MKKALKYIFNITISCLVFWSIGSIYLYYSKPLNDAEFQGQIHAVTLELDADIVPHKSQSLEVQENEQAEARKIDEQSETASEVVNPEEHNNLIFSRNEVKDILSQIYSSLVKDYKSGNECPSIVILSYHKKIEKIAKSKTIEETTNWSSEWFKDMEIIMSKLYTVHRQYSKSLKSKDKKLAQSKKELYLKGLKAFQKTYKNPVKCTQP